MSKQTQRITCWVSACALLIGVAAYVSHYQRVRAASMHNLSATVLQQPRALPAFTLVDHHNQPFTPASFASHWSLVFFGFTHCGYACPTTLAVLADAYDNLTQAGWSDLPEVVFISIDPQRDSTDALARYVQAFHPAFKGVRGEVSRIKPLAKAMAVDFQTDAPAPKRAVSNPSKAPTNMLNHSSSIILINPRGQVHAFFSPPHQPDVLAKEFMLIRQHASRMPNTHRKG